MSSCSGSIKLGREGDWAEMGTGVCPHIPAREQKEEAAKEAEKGSEGQGEKQRSDVLVAQGRRAIQEGGRD